MEIIDAQIHRPLPLAPWGEALSKESQLAADIELAVSAMEAIGVHAAIAYASEEFCAAAVARYPGKFGGVLGVRRPKDLGDPDSYCAELRSKPGLILGFRMGLLPVKTPADPEMLALITEGQWDPVFKAAAKHRVPVVIFVSGYLSLVNDIVRKHPESNLIIDHLGMIVPPVDPYSSRWYDAVPELLKLARFSNVAVKFTGVPSLSGESYPFNDLWPHLHRIIEAFKPERLMWGTDYTRVTGRWIHPPHPHGVSNYGELLNFLKYTNEIGEADKALMFSGAVRRWLRWAEPM